MNSLRKRKTSKRAQVFTFTQVFYTSPPILFTHVKRAMKNYKTVEIQGGFNWWKVKHEHKLYLFTRWFTTVRVLSRNFFVGEKLRVAEGWSFQEGGGDFWNEYAPRCNLVHFETQFWEMLQTRNASCMYTDLGGLMIFLYIYLYTVMITFFPYLFSIKSKTSLPYLFLIKLKSCCRTALPGVMPFFGLLVFVPATWTNKFHSKPRAKINIAVNHQHRTVRVSYSNRKELGRPHELKVTLKKIVWWRGEVRCILPVWSSHQFVTRQQIFILIAAAFSAVGWFLFKGSDTTCLHELLSYDQVIEATGVYSAG